MSRIASLLLTAALLVPSSARGAQDGGPAEKPVAVLLREFDHADASVREAAFDALEAREDPKVAPQVQRKLRSLANKWIRKAVRERLKALRTLLTARMKKLDPLALKERRAKLLDFLKAGNAGAMRPIVKELWVEFYFDPKEADRDGKVAAATARVEELAAWWDKAGSGKKEENIGVNFGEFLRSIDEAYLIQAVPRKDQRIMMGNARLHGKIPAEEYALVFMTNQYRVLLGKMPLRLDPKLCDAAREHSKDMKQHKFFSHTSPLPGKRTPSDRARKHGTSASGENIYVGSGDAEKAFWAWFMSIGHHRNMAGGYGSIGVGNHDRHWTEMFGG